MTNPLKPNVLVVDDSRTNRLAVEYALAGLDINLIKAESGEDALRHARQRDFALILMDIVMGGIDGFETGQLLRKDPRFELTPLIYLTGSYQDDVSRAKAYSVGAVDFLLKPADADVLRAKVQVFVELWKKSQEVKYQTAELTRLHDELEQRVVERTAELRKSEERLRILHQIDRALIAAEGPEAIAAAALPPLRQLLGVNRVVVNLFNLATGEVEWLAAAGRRRVHVGPGVRYSIRLMGDVEALQRGEPQLVDVNSLPPGPEVDALFASGVHTYAVIPMIAGGDLFGALSFGGPSGSYSSDQISIAQGAAAQFAIVLMQARLHDRLKRQAREFQSAFEDTNVPMGLTDINHRFVRVNAALARMFGYSVEELLGKSMPELTHPDDLAESFAQRELLNAGKVPYFQIEKRYLRKDRQVLWALANVSVIRDAAGKPLQYIGQVQDITERKQAEEALRQSEMQFRLVWENSLDGMRLTDSHGMVRRVNDAFCRMVGMPREALEGHPFTLIYPEEQRAELLAAFQKRFTASTTEPYYTKEIVLRNGRKVHLEISNSFLEMTGQPPQLLSIIRDVSDQIQMEAQLRQAQKLEAFGQLAGGVAHDFNNLLTIITGYSEMILSETIPVDQHAGFIREIRKAGNRAASLTRQLLAFSRKQMLQPVELDLNALISEAEKMLRRLIGEDIDLATALDPDLGQVKADPGQIEQVIMNLVVNARDAMPEGGHLTIETRNVELDQEYARRHAEIKPGRFVMLAVADSGCGMDEAIRANIFEPFFTTKEVGKGTGLGLATVHGIVKQSGGSIEVYSEVGRGTTFKIYLPRVNASPPSSKSWPGLSPTLPGTETILLAEDEEGVRTTVQLALEAHGYKVLSARSGLEALELCRQHPEAIHLLMTDVVMPKMSGRQLADQVVGLRPNIRVLYLSGYTDDAVVRHGVLEAGAAFLQKPFTPRALTRKVRDTLDGSSAR